MLIISRLLMRNHRARVCVCARARALTCRLFLVCYVEIFLIIIECILMRRLYYKWRLKEREAKKRAAEEKKQAGAQQVEPDVVGEEKRKWTWWLRTHFSIKNYGEKDAKTQNETRRWVEGVEDFFFALFILLTIVSFIAISVAYKERFNS
jgi:hypothetical protein